MKIDERTLGPQIGQAINLAFNEQMQNSLDKVDLDLVRERAKEILIMNVQLTADIKTTLNNVRVGKTGEPPKW